MSRSLSMAVFLELSIGCTGFGVDAFLYALRIRVDNSRTDQGKLEFVVGKLRHERRDLPQAFSIRVFCTNFHGLPDNQRRSASPTWKPRKSFAFLAFLSDGGVMGNLKLGANTTVFLVFFGISLLDAIVSHRWVNVVLWAAFGALFIRADNRKTAAP